MEFNYDLYPGRKRELIEFEEEDMKPKISIITAYYNGHKYIDETINSVLNQTYPYWEWLIVNDGSNDEESLKKLEEIKKIDKRIKVINKENEGPALARDFGVHESSKESEYIVFLDCDDLIEKTYLECTYLALETNKDKSWAYTDVVNFGELEFLWQKNFDVNLEKKDNLLVLTSMIRKKDFLKVNGFEVKEKDFFEDWFLWLKMLKEKMTPIRINTLGFWYRKKKEEESKLAKDIKNRKEIIAKMQETINEIPDNIKAKQYPKQYYNWELLEELDVEQPKRKKSTKKQVLLILPWFTMGGADKFNFDFIKGLSEKNYDFTIITTEPNINVWRQQFEEYATIYDLTTFLDKKYWPSFINYIIKKNNIDLIINSNSTFGYSAIPYIKACNPQVPIMDYIHMEEWYNRNGGFSRDTACLENVLDKTLVCNENSKKILVNYFKRKENKIETVYIGVDSNKFNPKNFNREEILNKYKIENDKRIIGFIARIDLQKRPYLLINIIKKLKEKRNDFIVIIAGDGPLLSEIKRLAKKYGIDKNIKFLGAVSNTEEIYAMSDVTLNCSIKEGLALTSYESLSMGVPVVSADVGGQAELINDEVGIIVPCLQKEKEILNYKYSEEEINNYVEAINKIFDNLEFYKSNARNIILKKFTIEKMVEKMDNVIKEILQKEKKINEYISTYKEVFKEHIVLNYVVHENEYRWLCSEVNKNLFGEEIEYTQDDVDKGAIKTREIKVKEKIVRLTVKLHIYRESKIILKILKSIKTTLVLCWQLIKQVIKRFLNLFRVRRKK